MLTICMAAVTRSKHSAQALSEGVELCPLPRVMTEPVSDD